MAAMIYVLILRFLHVVLGVFWGGAAMFLAWFLAPAVKASGPDGGKVMGALNTQTRWPTVIASAGGLTVLSGILLYARNWWPLLVSGQATGPAYGFLIGGIFGLAAIIFGGAGVGRLSTRVTTLGAEIASAGGPPDQNKLSEMAALQKQLESASNINAILIVIAVIMMSISRYLTF